MIIESDEWLGDILGYRSYRISKTDETPLIEKKDLLKAAEGNKSFFFAKIPSVNIGTLSSLCNAGFHVIDVNVTFQKTMTSDSDNYSMPSNFLIREYVASDSETLLNLAETCFKYSRFHLDPLLNSDVADKIKCEWIASYLKGSRGDGILVAEKDGKAVGFLAYFFVAEKDKKIGIIDLIGVNKDYRNCGVGKQMISYFAKSNKDKLSSVRVGTQIANIASINLYESCGFRILDSSYVLHAHACEGEIRL